MEVHDVVRKVQKWVTTATNAIDSEDGKLVEQVLIAFLFFLLNPAPKHIFNINTFCMS